MKLRDSIVSLFLGLAVASCGPSSGADGGDGGEPPAQVDDADGDGISDEHEGRAAEVDTDGDGIPDFKDEDSDGDGIPDAAEAGDDDPTTTPRDADRDGTPDFRDLDSDGNGIADNTATDTTDDLDGDGVGNWADLDDDGDRISDEVEIRGAAEPPDTDGDGVVDMQDLDSDADTISDRDEGTADPDGDDTPAYLDGDSDDDCRLDSIEAGDAVLDTPPKNSDDDPAADFVDIDSDNDGLPDGGEDSDCDGIQGVDETAADDDDTDDDGVSDLVEDAAGTSPLDPADNPQANGDFVFVVPYEEAPSPGEDDLDFSTELKQVDVYVLVDISQSMQDELDSIRDNMQTVLENLACAPAGNGAPGSCIPDLWSGIGSVLYPGEEPYRNRLSLQPNPSLISSAVPPVDTGSCSPCNETQLLALWATATGQGSGSSTCAVSDGFQSAPTCAGSPAGVGGIGYPCFRPNALPVILLATDEEPSDYECPSPATTINALNGIGAKMIGIFGTSPSLLLRSEMSELATGTGAVSAAGDPLVFDGADANAASAIQDAVLAVSQVPLDITATAVDETGDPVDTVTAFVDHLETLQLGTADCADGLSGTDGDGDGFDDSYVDVLPGTPVCWKLVAKDNTTVPATPEPQLYRATVEVFGDGVTLLDTRNVYFLVPPDLEQDGID